MPSTPAEFRRVPGVGDRKASDLGPAFLAEIAAYARETGATPAPLPEPEVRPRSRNGMSQTVLTSLDMFRQGNDVTTIARARSLTPTTIEGHLADAILAGERLDVDQLIAPQKRRSIEAAMVELGSGYLGPVKERLGDAYSYGELRLVQALLQARAAR
jgi:ATP-dependent DNA helicase RecQ